MTSSNQMRLNQHVPVPGTFWATLVIHQCLRKQGKNPIQQQAVCLPCETIHKGTRSLAISGFHGLPGRLDLSQDSGIYR
jgi:hypothetical protein